MHTHDFSELVIVVGGRGVHLTGEAAVPVARGDVFIINGGIAHGYRGLENLRLYNVLFDLDRMGLPLFDLWESPVFWTLFRVDPARRAGNKPIEHLHLDEARLEAVVALVRRDQELEARTEAPAQFLRMAVFMELVALLISYFEADYRDADRSGYRLGKVFAYIEANLSRNPSTAELCAVGALSESSLLRACRELTGLSPKRFHAERRLRRAADLLDRGDSSVTDIAYALGYGDSNYFCRRFRQRYGLSPIEYRRRAKKG
jgi:AraC-like DNA-binding protein